MKITHANIITSAIVRRLVALGLDVPVYREQVLQTFQTPCFFVRIIEQGVDYGLSKYERYSFKMEVSFFTDEQDGFAFEHGNAALFQMVKVTLPCSRFVEGALTTRRPFRGQKSPNVPFSMCYGQQNRDFGDRVVNARIGWWGLVFG